MPTQRLTPVDASFLHLEGPNTHMHIGGCVIFEANGDDPASRHENLIRLIEPRLDRMARYRQKVAFVPLRLDVPVWVDAAEFNIHNHVLRAALPAPGGDRELQQYVSRVFSRPLDRRRPLWELYVIEGLQGGRWAVLTKVHHSMVDGISTVELLTALLDVEPQVPEHFGESDWHPGPVPSSLDLVLQSMRERAGRPRQLAGATRDALQHPRHLAAGMLETAGGLLATLGTVRAPRSILNGPTGPSRAWTFARFPLAGFRAVKTSLGGTINDVVLAAVTGGLRGYLLEHGVNPADEPLQALCPVSLRGPADQGALGNRLAMLLVRLPIDEPDPVRRYARVRKTVDALKERKQAVGADFLLNVVGFTPSTLHAQASRASLRALGFNLIITNVPGPQFPLYCLGSRLVEAFPAAFLYSGQHLAVAIFSYDGQLNFGFIADAEAMPDLDRFTARVVEGVDDLMSAAARRAATRRAATRGAATRGAATPATPSRRRSPDGKAATTRTRAATGSAARAVAPPPASGAGPGEEPPAA